MKRIAAIIATSMLAGCGIVPGSDDFACKGYPEGVSCVAARDVYKLSNSRDRVTQQDANEAGVPIASRGATSNTDEKLGTVAPRARSVATEGPGVTPHPSPLRTPATILRVWVAPWQTESGDLVLAGYVFTEIEMRRWVVGMPEAQIGNRLPTFERDSIGRKETERQRRQEPARRIPSVERLPQGPKSGATNPE